MFSIDSGTKWALYIEAATLTSSDKPRHIPQAMEAIKKIAKLDGGRKKIELPVAIAAKLNDPKLSKEGARIRKALKAQANPKPIDTENLDRNKLKKIARHINMSSFHCSGNCTLLARSVLYNINHGQERLGAVNSFPIYKPLKEKELQSIIPTWRFRNRYKGIEELESSVKMIHEIFGSHCCIVNVWRKIPGMNRSIGHAFNAVIIKGAEGSKEVQFVDAWRKRNPTPSKKELARIYGSATFDIELELPSR